MAEQAPNEPTITPGFLERYMNARGFMVIGTTDPESHRANVARHEFGQIVRDDGSITIICDCITGRHTYQNIQHDPHVSIEIGSQDDELTLQMQGVARGLEGDELASMQVAYAAKSNRLGRNARVEDFIGRTGIAWLAIDITGWEFTDVSHRPQWLRVKSTDQQ